VADNKVLIEFQIVEKGGKISAVAKDTEKLSKSQDKAAKSQKNLTKQQDMGYGRQKQGLVQTANSTKNFSKLANTIDGGGGGTSLVGAYATLAANVFAASAAFNALSRAAEFQQLQQGLELVGNQSGRTLSVLADNLREATDGALSLEQASRGAALGVSGGFGARELSGLAEIAKGASLALGRDLADAFDRLTRGAIKLEPEILDELGIMVRLDDAVEQYAAQLQKSASSLSQLERRQAFMNAILEQGALKFGDIAKQVEPTPYQKLAATFGDLVREIFTFVNETLNLNGIIGILANSTTSLLGVMLLFGSTIAGQILPGLANAGANAARFAEGAKELAEGALDAAKANEKLALANVQAFEGGAKKFQLAQKELAIEGKSTAARKNALKSLEASERGRARNLKKHHGAARKQKEIELEQIRRQIRLVKELEAAEAGQSAARLAASQAQIQANFAQEQSEIIQGVSSGELGLAAAITASNAAIDKRNQEQKKLNKTGKKTGGIFGKLLLLSTFIGTQFEKLIGIFKVVGAVLLRLLPLIGAIVTVTGLAFLAFDRTYNTEKVKAFRKSNKQLAEILETLPDKAEAFNDTFKSTATLGQRQIRQFQIVSNTIAEVNAQLEKSIKLRKEAIEANDGQEINDKGFVESLGDFLSMTTKGRNKVVSQLQEVFDDSVIGSTENTSENMKRLKGMLSSVFDIKRSPEYTSYESLLKSGIPSLVEKLEKEVDFEKIFFDDEGNLDTQENIRKRLAEGIKDTKEQFEELGSSVQGFNQELQNAEKVSSQFVLKFFPKTAATDIVNQFKSLKKGLDEINNATQTAGMDPAERLETIAGAIAETGPNVRKILGSAVRDPINSIIQLRGEIAKLEAGSDEDKESQIQERREKIQQELNKLGENGEQTLKDTLATLTNIQKNEVLRKVTLAQIAQVQKTVKQATKFSSAATELSLKLDAQKLKLKKEESDQNLLLLANTAGVTQEQIAQDGVVNALVKKREELVGLGGKEEEILAIDLQLAEARNIQTDQALATASESFRVEEAKQKVLLTNLATTEKELEAKLKILELEAKAEALQAGRATVGVAAQVRLQVNADKERLKIAKDKAKIEKAILNAQASIITAELAVLRDKQDVGTVQGKAEFDRLNTIISNVNSATTASTDAIDKVAEQTEMSLTDALADAVQKSFFDSPIANDIDNIAVNRAFSSTIEDDTTKTTFALNMIRNAFESFGNKMEELFGEDGKVIAALSKLLQITAEVSLGIIQSFQSIDEMFNKEDGFFKDFSDEEGKTLKGLLKFAAVAQSVSGVLSGFQAVLQADSERRVNAIDQAIDAEKRLDGKSKESLAKIAAMEKKKESMQRKAFERNKKLQIANAIISTASAAATTYAALAENPFLAMAMAAAITALGLAQVAIIRKTQFNGGNTDPSTPNKTNLQIGKRGSAVDVAKSATAGELNFLRGGNTSGTDLGGAGGGLPGASMGRRGYADGGVIVGERGPEVITPAAPVDVTPNFALGGQGANVNFTINAIDAAGVEDVLMNQRGNIIGMIRDAANENGERFLETVDTQAYGGNK